MFRKKKHFVIYNLNVPFILKVLDKFALDFTSKIKVLSSTAEQNLIRRIIPFITNNVFVYLNHVALNIV